MICMKGGVFFMCELAKKNYCSGISRFLCLYPVTGRHKVDGVVKIVKDLDQPLEGKEVLVVEEYY